MAKVKKKRIYIYNFPEIREIGIKIKGTSGFIWREMLDKRYSKSLIMACMRGERNNPEIVECMKAIVKLSNVKNY